MIDFKPTIRLTFFQPQILFALLIAEQEYDKFGTNMLITSVDDSIHSPRSLHNKGLAIDLRTKGIGLADQLVQAIRNKLKPIGFDVLFEDPGGPNEHCHIEYDPK